MDSGRPACGRRIADVTWDCSPRAARSLCSRPISSRLARADIARGGETQVAWIEDPGERVAGTIRCRQRSRAGVFAVAHDDNFEVPVGLMPQVIEVPGQQFGPGHRRYYDTAVRHARGSRLRQSDITQFGNVTAARRAPRCSKRRRAWSSTARSGARRARRARCRRAAAVGDQRVFLDAQREAHLEDLDRLFTMFLMLAFSTVHPHLEPFKEGASATG